MGTRDLLSPVAAPYGSENDTGSKLLDHLVTQSRLLEDIAKSLRKLSPNILCTTVVDGAIANPASGIRPYIADTNWHRVRFEVGGKPVEIYRVAFWTSDLVSSIRLNLESTAVGGGSVTGFFPFSDITNTMPFPTILDVALSEIWIKTANSGTDPFYVNQAPGNATTSVLWIYGWTVNQFD